MTERCKCCGQVLPPDKLPDGVSFTFTKRGIWELVSKYPGINTESLVERVYSHRRDGGPSDPKNIHVHVCQMNRLLRRHGLEIRGHITDGYRVREL